MSAGRGSDAALDALHGLLTDALRAELEAALQVSRSGGDPVNPQLLDKIMKFLAMNGVDAPASSPRVDALASELADLDLDAIASGRPN